MNWKIKSKIQNAVSLLPSSVSYATYYWIQRHFGALKNKTNPMAKMESALKTWKQIQKLGHNPKEKVFFEVGTGRIPMVPVAYWLMGAKSTITIDLNPYMKAELIEESLDYLLGNKKEVEQLFGDLLNQKRFNKLVHFCKNQSFSTDSFLDVCQIQYIAPSDASKTELKENSIDFHTSYTVFEHIPPMVLKKIIQEGNRIICKEGLFVHRIDYSDHFAGTDKKISAINFLQYSDYEWNKYAGNRYMYMNRLRHDDFLNMFKSSGHEILLNKPDIDERSFYLLKTGNFQVNEKFITKSKEMLSITGAWLVTQKKG